MESSYSLLARSGPGDYLRFISHTAIFADVVNAAMETGLLAELGDMPRSAAEIAWSLKLNVDAVDRVLRVLSGLKICHSKDHKYVATIETKLLMDSSPSGMGHQMRLFSGPEFRRSWQQLSHSLKTGRTGFGHAHGSELFEYLDRNPDASLRFNRGWQSITSHVGNELADHYDFSSLEHVLDVGGNRGAILVPILNQNPHLRATLFDLPASLAGAEADLARGNVLDRVRIVEGDAMVSVPATADCALLKSVIHVCNDDQAATILRQVAGSLEPGSEVILIERVLLDTPHFDWSTMVDLTMLVITGGKERTVDSYRYLFESSGFDYSRCVRLPSGFSLIIGRKR